MSSRASWLRRLASVMDASLGPSIEARLGGYRVRVVEPEPHLPPRLDRAPNVAVIGGGLAGIAAASTLARRGARVTLFESSARIGGKIGGETIEIDGRPYSMDHGFHAFFRHYYNLDTFLRELGVRPALVPIDDYVIVNQRGDRWGFGDVKTTPGLNLLDLAGKDLYRLGEVLFSGARRHMNAFLEYDREATFTSLDRLSFGAWATRAGLPASLRRVLAIFARAFFADEDKLSAAEVVKAFHFYYLAHDHGLLYDYPTGPYASHVIAAIEAHLESAGVRIVTETAVQSVVPRAQGFLVDGVFHDAVVVATPAIAAKALALRSPDLRAACPDLTRRLGGMHAGQRYAVLRLFVDRDIRPGLPVFVAIEGARVLDAVARYHAITEQDAAWASRHGGAVLELHSYAVPDDLPDDAAIRAALVAELVQVFPELSGFRELDSCLRVRADFTALHVGMAKSRPRTATEHPHLVLAGDWVALPVPAMLMEGAFTSGLYAANALLERWGVQRALVESVPLRGLLAKRRARGPSAVVSAP